jgi:hypothetical protein
MEHEIERLAAREVVLLLAKTVDRHAVAGRRQTAEQAPGPAFHAVNLRVEAQSEAPSMNIEGALAEIAELQISADPAGAAVLEEYRSYLTSLGVSNVA